MGQFGPNISRPVELEPFSNHEGRCLPLLILSDVMTIVQRRRAGK